MCLICNAVDNPTSLEIKEVKGLKGTTTTPIAETTGSGCRGEASLTSPLKEGKLLSSYYVDVDCPDLDLLQDIIVSSLKVEPNIIKSTKHRKSMLLKYSKGAENWTHTDGNNGQWFSYQALLMLSDSAEYDGGEFYVAKRDGEKIIRTCCPTLNAGDLIIFQAGSGQYFQGLKYFHGMKKVTRGERVAAGLLQVRDSHPEEEITAKGTKKRKNTA
jgi:hypothetical protein